MKKIVFAMISVFVVLLCVSSCASEINDSTSSRASTTSTQNTNKIETEYFELYPFESWKNKYTYSYIENLNDIAVQLNVYMISDNEFGEAHLFGIDMISVNDVESISLALETWVEPVGLLTTDSGEQFFVGVSYASEMSCTQTEEKQFLSMVEDIPSVLSTIKSKKNHSMSEWDNSYLDDTPYVNVSYGVLGMNFNTVKNSLGGIVYEMENKEFLKSFHVNCTDNVKFYYCSDYYLMGVEDEKIVFWGYFPENKIVSYSGSTVRDVLNYENLVELFSVPPKQSESNQPDIPFISWKIKNGYIGMVSVGSWDISRCYDNYPTVFVAFSDKNLCSIYE